MAEWWYADGDKRAGPVDVAELKRLFQKGSVGLGTLVWCEGMAAWKPLGEVDDLKSLLAAVPPPLPTAAVPPPLPTESAPPPLPLKDAIDPLNYPMARPWPRFFARTFDVWWETMLVSFLMGMGLALVGLGACIDTPPWVDNLFSMIIYASMNPTPAAIASTGFIWLCFPVALVFDSVVLGAAGNTPGKALLGLRVMTVDGHRLRFVQHLKRNMSMWIRGMCIGIPIANLFAMDAQERRLKRGQQASYDEPSRLTVRSRPIGMGRKLVLAVGLIAMLGINFALREAGRHARSGELFANLSAFRGADRVKQCVTRGDECLKNSQYDQAIKEFDEAIRSDPANAYALTRRAIAWQRKQEFDKALADYDQVIRLEPRDADHYVGRGDNWALKAHAESRPQDYGKAIADYGRAIAMDATKAIYFSARGDAYFAVNDYDRAIEDYSKAIRLDPKNAMVLFSRGTTWAQKRGFDQAVADFTEAIQLNPKNPTYYFGRANVWFGHRDYGNCISDCDEAIRLDPKDFAAYFIRGSARVEIKDYEKAVSDFDVVIRLEPANAYYYVCRADAWMRKLEYDKAIADFDKALQLDPNNTMAIDGRKLVRQMSGR
jgi:tetratricopeptide (TPR) repeat protein/uncharacterized RDD family membrane protein YckC